MLLNPYLESNLADIQVVPVLLETFQKYPKLYETSVVWSFYPQVVYKVRLISKFPI